MQSAAVFFERAMCDERRRRRRKKNLPKEFHCKTKFERQNTQVSERMTTKVEERDDGINIALIYLQTYSLGIQ